MFDLGATELLLIVIVAVLVIGPKDMPLALRTAGRWIGKMRRVSSHFRTGLDAMVREAEMEEMEKKWQAQNEKVMRQHPEGAPAEMEPTGALPPPRKNAASQPAADEKPSGGSADSQAPAPAASDAGQPAARGEGGTESGAPVVGPPPPGSG